MTTTTTTPLPTPWPLWRKLLVVLGLLVAAATMWASPQRFPQVEWIGGASVGVANVVASFLLLVGWPRRQRTAPVDASRGRRAVRLLAHPLVTAPVNTLVVIAVFALHLYDRAAATQTGWSLLIAFLVLMGLYADAAVIIPGILPTITPGLQVLCAAAAGILDEFPGIAVMVMHHHAVGVAMWIVAQPVIFPVLGVLLLQWLRHDQQRAREEDARLDALELQERQAIAAVLRGSTTPRGSAPGAPGRPRTR